MHVFALINVVLMILIKLINMLWKEKAAGELYPLQSNTVM